MWSFDDVYRVFVDARTDPMPGTVGGGNTQQQPDGGVREGICWCRHRSFTWGGLELRLASVSVTSLELLRAEVSIRLKHLT